MHIGGHRTYTCSLKPFEPLACRFSPVQYLDRDLFAGVVGGTIDDADCTLAEARPDLIDGEGGFLICRRYGLPSRKIKLGAVLAWLSLLIYA